MRSLLWGIVFGVSAAVSAMASAGADEIGLDSHLLTPVADDEAFEGQAAGCCDELDADCPSRRFYITGIIGALVVCGPLSFYWPALHRIAWLFATLGLVWNSMMTGIR